MANVPRCHTAMHCCKQCVHFDTGRQFECTQPIPERIAKKDAKNDCTFFEFRMTVEKDTSPVTLCQRNAGAYEPGTSERRAQGIRRPLQEVTPSILAILLHLFESSGFVSSIFMRRLAELRLFRRQGE